MVGLSLNLVLEFTALVATWTRGLQWLRAFLVYELTIDLLGLVIPMTDYLPWYYYWGARTVELFLVLNILPSGQMVTKLWKLLSNAIFVATSTVFWSGRLTTARAEEFVRVGALILLSVVILEFVLRPRDWTVWLGQSLWVVALIVPLKGYPFITLLPLVVWSTCLLRRRDTAPEAKGENGKSKSTRETGPFRSRVEILPRTMSQQ